ncbi:MAG: hypothetical protein KAI67_02085 [Candidatus Pacebacteria bacterium]|nr:hypothetical protein [Candidatus Paceibacterota bacterium]
MENENEKIKNKEETNTNPEGLEVIASDDTNSEGPVNNIKNTEEGIENNIAKNISNNINAELDGIEKKTFSNKIESTFPSVKKKKKDLGLFIMGFIFLIAASGFAAYYFFFNKKEDVFKKEDISHSQQIIKSSLEAMSGVSSYNFDGRFDVNFKGEISENSIKVSVSGSEDGSDVNIPKASYDFGIDSEVDIDQERTSFFLDLGVMSFGKGEEAEIYMNLKNLDSELLESIPEVQLDSYKNKWYELRMKDLKDMGILSSEIFDVIDSSKENKLDIKGIYEKYDLFNFKSDLGDEKLGNVDVYHYSVEADSNALIDLYIELIREGLLMQEQGEISSMGLMNDFDEAIDKFEENPEYREIIKDFSNEVKIEMWIGKDDNFIYKVKIHLEMNEDSLKNLERRIDEIEGLSSNNSVNSREDTFSFSINIELNMSEFNQPLNIEKPKDYENLLMVLMKSAMSSSLSSSVDSDGDGLTDDMELMFKTDINNPDTDGDGFTDGDEIDGGYDPLIPGDAKLNMDAFLGV